MKPELVKLIKETATQITRQARTATFERNAIPAVENELIAFLTKADELDKTETKSE